MSSLSTVLCEKTYRATRQPFFGHVPTVAGFGISQNELIRFQQSFARFNVKTRPMLWTKKMDVEETRCEAFVLKLGSRATEFLKGIRESKRNRRAVVYGVGDQHSANQCCRLAINSVLPDCSPESILKAVENTHLLLVNHLRQYARFPLVIPACLQSENQTTIVTTRDISSTGISVELRGQEWKNSPVRVSFVLPGTDPFSLHATRSWRAADAIGFHFTPSEDHERLKSWVAEFLSAV